MSSFFKSIRENPLYLFLFRISAVLTLSSIFWVASIVGYYEYKVAESVAKEIERERGKLAVILKSNNINADFARQFDEYAMSNEAPIIEIFDENKKELVSFQNSDLPSALQREIGSFAKASDNEKYKLIILSENDAFLYFQTKLLIGKKSYYINILAKLDDNTILMIKNNVYTSLVVIFLTILIVVISVFPIIYSQYKSILEKKNELALSHLNTLKSLGAAIAKRDSDTSEHNYRVTYYSVKIAEAMGYDKKFIESLIKGAFLHDVGKIAISDAILLKPSRLSEKEFEIMKTHVLHGVDIVDDIAWIKEAKNVIAYHHERVDGGGYPMGVKSEDIPMQAKIFAVADVFDALTSKRPYKEAFDAQKSFELIRGERDKHFDGRVVSIFEKLYQVLYKEMQNKNPKELESVFQLMLQGYF